MVSTGLNVERVTPGRGLLRRRALLWLAPAGFLLLFFYFPLVRILRVSFRSASLAQACKTTLEQAKAQYTSFGCAF